MLLRRGRARQRVAAGGGGGTATTIDTFTGADGAALANFYVDSSDGLGTGTILGNRGRLTAATNYNKTRAFSTAQYGGGEVRMDFVVDLGGAEQWLTPMAYVREPYNANYNYTPIDGYAVHIVFSSGATTLEKAVSEARTTLATLAGTSASSYATGDIIHIAIRPGTGAWIWKNADARPASPNLPSTDATFTIGRVGWGMQSGGAARTWQQLADDFVHDTLVAAPAPAYTAGFETDTGGWVALSNATIARSTVRARTGAASLAVTPNAAGNYDARSTNRPVTITTGNRVRVSAWVWTTNAGSAQIIVNEATAAGAYITDKQSGQSYQPAGRWMEIAFEFVPSSTTGNIDVIVQGLNGTGSMWVDDVSITVLPS